MGSEAEESPTHKLKELIGDGKVAMLTTLDEQGNLHSRPMMTQALEEPGDLWFFTSRTSGKVLSLANDNRVNLAYSEPKDSRFISIAGQADLVSDPEKIKALWDPLNKAWFPKGLDDPDLALLKVTVESAEYWDPVSSKRVQIFGVAKAVITGEPYQGTENHRLSLHH